MSECTCVSRVICPMHREEMMAALELKIAINEKMKAFDEKAGEKDNG